MKACHNGHLEIVKLLLEQKGIDVIAQDSRGMSALTLSIEKGYSEITKLLLSQNDIDINIENVFLL